MLYNVGEKDFLLPSPPRLEGSLPVYFCHYTSHYVAWSRSYDPRPFTSTPITARPRNRFEIYRDKW